jgi:prevent-host-death family protein
MGRYSVVEAKKRLSELIDRALKGEAVVITQHGRPVIKLKPISGAAKPILPRPSLGWMKGALAAESRARTLPPSCAGCATSGRGERQSYSPLLSTVHYIENLYFVPDFVHFVRMMYGGSMSSRTMTLIRRNGGVVHRTQRG